MFSELPRRFGLPLRRSASWNREGILDRLAGGFDHDEAPPGLGASADRLLAELVPEG